MILIYSATALVDISLARQSLRFFVEVFIQIVPILTLVFFLMVLVNLILTPERIRNYLGKTSGLKGWVLAMTGGIFSTGPIYTWYILLGELKQQGMKTSLAAVFLYSRAVKLPLLPLLVHYFGLSYTIILSLYLVFFSIISGIVTGVLADESNAGD
jgi:uncharacterized membrane protein YraQ (UPF0718 family)